MRTRPSARLSGLARWALLAAACALLLLGVGLGRPAPAAGDPAGAGGPPTASPEVAGDPAPTGWSPGQVAAGMKDLLAVAPPVPVDVPAAIGARVTGPTALFYFSPTCPHCRNVMGEINALTVHDDLAWVGVAYGAARPEDLDEFRSTFQPAFDILVDSDRGFAGAVGARSTPSLYIARPRTVGEGAVDTLMSPPAEGTVRIELTEVYTPYQRGFAPILRMRRHPATPFADFSGHQGETACRACHEQEGLSMAITHHAAAFWTLYRDKDHDKAECVGCHVTGMGEPGGFVAGDIGHPLASVQCEACHGPSGPHDGTSDDARASCVGCHDADHSIAFSVEKGLPHIDHFKANDMELDALRAQLAAVQEGRAEKPLLAFPEGPTVGAAACQSCHKPQHKWLQKSPHGQAMATLRGAPDGDQRGEVGCVRCHATAQAYGPGAPRAAVSDFRTDEGVGCESCHGPGAAHVADPTADNIVGLGGSCPVCVIEAVCTSCHTPDQDPDWDLSPALKAIDH